MAGPFTIETGYPAATDVQSAFPAHEQEFRQTMWDWLNVFSDPSDGSLLPGAFTNFLATANTWSGKQTFDDLAIGGDVDALSVTGNVTIGGTLGVTGASTLHALDATTGDFSGALSAASITASGTMTAVQNFVSSTAAAILAPTGAGTVYMRPNGAGSATGQAYVTSTGNMVIAGDLTVSGGNITGTASGNAAIGTQIVAGNGLTGGGTLAASRTLNVGAGTGISVAADTVSVSADVWRDGNMPTLAQLEALGVAGVYTGSNVNNLDFPIGTTIGVSDSKNSYSRNQAVTIYLSTSAAYFQVAANGTPLTGTWRSRGRLGNDGGSGDSPHLTLFQRTS